MNGLNGLHDSWSTLAHLESWRNNGAVRDGIVSPTAVTGGEGLEFGVGREELCHTLLQLSDLRELAELRLESVEV